MPPSRRFRRLRKLLTFTSAVVLVIVLVVLVQRYGLVPLRIQVERMGTWAPLGIFILRSISIIFPALPSTVYSILAGALLGFPVGIFTIILSDLIACQIAFLLSHHYGRTLVRKFVGKQAITRIEHFSRGQLEGNFFLMTGLLMTGMFDFVCYAAGLAGIRWRSFTPALLLSIMISDPPIVALGAGLLSGGRLILSLALLGIIGLAIISALVRRSVPKKS
ncbi:TVP38/TMEM64 family protein [cyanobiont of Ornithocercus magnificus]|nr:TVP38/TMEM64 family protein [cyanobiont of Ornithocercus magnificus]